MPRPIWSVARTGITVPVEVVVDPGITPHLDDAVADRWLQALAATLVARGGDAAPLEGAVCLRLCDVSASRELNATYRQRDKASNVLSFPAEVAVPEVALLGDLAICVPVVAQEAATQEKEFEDNLAHLFMHGVLHLLGYDHETAAEADAMEAVERDALATLNIADPYEIRPAPAPCQAD